MFALDGTTQTAEGVLSGLDRHLCWHTLQEIVDRVLNHSVELVLAIRLNHNERCRIQ
jgi:hypothetical protein